MEHETEHLVVVVLLGCSGLVAVVIAVHLKQLHAPGAVYATFAERLKSAELLFVLHRKPRREQRRDYE